MSIQASLEDEEWKTWKKNIFDSKEIRDISYIQIQEDKSELSKTQNMVYQIIKQNPEGITDKEIVRILQRYSLENSEEFKPLPVTSVTARRNELMNKDLVKKTGEKYITDYNGSLHLNSLWGITKSV